MPHSNVGWVDRLEEDGQLARLSAMLCRQLEADGVALSVVDGDDLLHAASHGPSVAAVARGSRRGRADGGLAWRAVAEQRPVVLPDARGVPLGVDPRLSAGAAAAAPIYAIAAHGGVDRGETLGTLVWIWDEPQAFAPTILDDVERSAVFASLQVELEFALAREKAERDLAAQVVEALGEVMLVVGSDGKINRVNASAERLFGYPREQLLRMSVDELVPAAARGDHARRRASFLDEGAPSRQMGARSTDIRAVRADGVEVPVEVGLSLLPGEEHAPPQVIAIVSDISERLRSQAAAERQQRLEAVGQFAGGLAHDVNNALTVILGFTRMAHDRTGDAELRTLLQQVLEAGNHAGELSKQLLVFARTEPQPVVPLDVNALLQELQAMASRLLGDHIVVETHLADPLPAALGDPTQLQQVLVNLVLNARDAMPAGGTIALRSRCTSLEPGHDPRRLTGDVVQISVADTGVGMDEETLLRATDPFFTTKGEHGTGLGLSTAYTLVAALGGELSLDSAPGRGTTVSIALPLADGLPEAPAAGSPPRSAATTRLAVLLVEDAPAVRLMTATMLRALGHDVTAAASPRDALLHDLGAFDLVVSDVEMPGMSGPEMVEEMRARRPGLAVVYTSGYSSDSQSEQRRVAAGAPFVMKPFTPDELAHGIEQALSHASG